MTMAKCNKIIYSNIYTLCNVLTRILSTPGSCFLPVALDKTLKEITMSFYRSLLAAVAAIVITSPVFADDTASTQSTDNNAIQLSDSSSATSTTTEETTTTTSDDQATTKVNLNTASAKDLMKVKGLNASKAKAIVAYRKKHGSFQSTADIAKVKGFRKLSTDSLQLIQDQLTVE